MDDALLASARTGDAASFEALVAPFRRELTAHCYRLTGSLSDADDLLQESLLRAWKGLGTFQGTASLRSWLYRIATNACLTELERRPRRAMPGDLSSPCDPSARPPDPVMDPVWLDPCPDALWMTPSPGPEARLSARESVAIAFLAAIQTLPPLQRAVLIFRDVLGWSASEVADSLETTVASVNSALQRARETLEKRRGSWETLTPEDEKARTLLSRYVQAWESGNADALAALLRDDATFTMPPMPGWYAGREAIVRFLSGLMPTLGQMLLVPVGVSAGPGIAVYMKGANGMFNGHSLHALRVAPDGRIQALDAFIGGARFSAFGLAQELEGCCR